MVFELILTVVAASLLPGGLVVLFMRKALLSSYKSIFGHEIVESWQKIVQVLIIISSLTGGVYLHYLEKYIIPAPDTKEWVVEALNTQIILYEGTRALIGASRSVISVLLFFLVFSVLIVLVLKIKNLWNTSGPS